MSKTPPIFSDALRRAVELIPNMSARQLEEVLEVAVREKDWVDVAAFAQRLYEIEVGDAEPDGWAAHRDGEVHVYWLGPAEQISIEVIQEGALYWIRRTGHERVKFSGSLEEAKAFALKEVGR